MGTYLNIKITLQYTQLFGIMKSRAQADKKMKEGKDYITTGLFNWSKDYASASTSFEEAFKLYKQAQAYDDCIKALKQLLLCNDKLKDMWAMARNQQSMINIYIDGHAKIENKELIELTQQAFCQFRIANSTDNGLKLAGKVAKHLIKQGHRKDGLDLLKLCYQQSLEQEKSYSKDGAFDILVSTMLENNMLEQAIGMYKQKIQREKGTNKCIQLIVLTYIVLLILNRDIKEADAQNLNFMGSIESYLSSSECEAACNLIKYYKEGNVAKFTKEASRAIINAIYPITILKKLRQFKLPVISVQQTAQPQQVQHQEKQLIKDLFY